MIQLWRERKIQQIKNIFGVKHFLPQTLSKTSTTKIFADIPIYQNIITFWTPKLALIKNEQTRNGVNDWKNWYGFRQYETLSAIGSDKRKKKNIYRICMCKYKIYMYLVLNLGHDLCKYTNSFFVRIIDKPENINRM